MVHFRTTSSALVLFLFVATLLACGGSTESPSAEIASPPEASPKQTAADIPEPAAPAEKTGDNKLGAALENPSRYYGVYASAEQPNREWFIAEAKRSKYAEQAPEVPPGHLALGAMFGDVAPYHLKTLTETQFEQSWVPDFQPEPISIEFDLDSDGHAVALKFTDQQNASLGRLDRQGNLPEDWE